MLFFLDLIAPHIRVDGFLHPHTSLDREQLRKVKEAGHPSSVTLVTDRWWQIREANSSMMRMLRTNQWRLRSSELSLTFDSTANL
ncbi:hypothetical protein Hanom_Chr05g00428091 [Helianthus anomalus]